MARLQFSHEHLGTQQYFHNNLPRKEAAELFGRRTRRHVLQKFKTKKPYPDMKAWWWKCYGLGLLYCITARTADHCRTRYEFSIIPEAAGCDIFSQKDGSSAHSKACNMDTMRD